MSDTALDFAVSRVLLLVFDGFVRAIGSCWKLLGAEIPTK